MAGRRFKVGPRITVQLHNEEFEEMRHDPAIEKLFAQRGDTWTYRLNSELARAQAKRKQPVEEGYTYHISHFGSRIRMYVLTYTARAMAHERKHSSILKLMETTNFGYEVKMRHELTEAQRGVEAHAKASTVRRVRREASEAANRRKAARRELNESRIKGEK